ncbi:MAG: rhodanese-like domain-containing protein [Methanomassiliicoccales archaeon]|nr:rhodanese-like domain-containing protein [Methanomassiliicoccales archaeon]
MSELSEVRVIKVAPSQFLKVLEDVKNGDCVLIDVRNPEEFRMEQIDGAKNVPVSSLVTELSGMDRDANLILYCKAGNRSNRAAEVLKDMGFRHISVLEGGIESLKLHLRG